MNHLSATRWSLALAALLSLSASSSTASAFVIPPSATTARTATTTPLFVSQLDRTSEQQDADKKSPGTSTVPTTPVAAVQIQRTIPGRKDVIQLLDPSTYESELLSSWTEGAEAGFDWEVEKARRYFAGLRLREDGSWVKQPSWLDFLVTRTRASSMNSDAPKPVNLMDVITLVTINVFTNLGFGTGMAKVPDAVIQKYEGSFLSFIKGVLGGDLQTLAGGPLFLLLAKYYHDYGAIFNLSFGPKSFLVVSDPVMARHILKESSAEQYCKGMLAEILEPIMGKGLIPADPATWKVSFCC